MLSARLDRRGLGPAIAVGVAVGLLAGLAAFGVLALPLFGLAQAVEPQRALDRPWFRSALFGVVTPLSIALGATAGFAAGRWYRQGRPLQLGEERK